MHTPHFGTHPRHHHHHPALPPPSTPAHCHSRTTQGRTSRGSEASMQPCRSYPLLPALLARHSRMSRSLGWGWQLGREGGGGWVRALLRYLNFPQSACRSRRILLDRLWGACRLDGRGAAGGRRPCSAPPSISLAEGWEGTGGGGGVSGQGDATLTHCHARAAQMQQYPGSQASTRPSKAYPPTPHTLTTTRHSRLFLGGLGRGGRLRRGRCGGGRGPRCASLLHLDPGVTPIRPMQTSGPPPDRSRRTRP